jgi:hypothetical protein
MRDRYKLSTTLALGVVLGLAGTSLAGLWNKAELNHARNVEKDRKARIRNNKAGMALVKDADIRRLTEAKIACYERSVQLIDRYKKAIKDDKLVQAKKLREALHLLRLQGESYNEAIELYTTSNGYKLARKPVKAALIGTLRETAKGLENQAKAYDAGIATLTQ